MKKKMLLTRYLINTPLKILANKWAATKGPATNNIYIKI